MSPPNDTPILDLLASMTVDSIAVSSMGTIMSVPSIEKRLYP